MNIRLGISAVYVLSIVFCRHSAVQAMEVAISERSYNYLTTPLLVKVNGTLVHSVKPKSYFHKNVVVPLQPGGPSEKYQYDFSHLTFAKIVLERPTLATKINYFNVLDRINIPTTKVLDTLYVSIDTDDIVKRLRTPLDKLNDVHKSNVIQRLKVYSRFRMNDDNNDDAKKSPINRWIIDEEVDSNQCSIDLTNATKCLITLSVNENQTDFSVFVNDQENMHPTYAIKSNTLEKNLPRVTDHRLSTSTPAVIESDWQTVKEAGLPRVEIYSRDANSTKSMITSNLHADYPQHIAP